MSLTPADINKIAHLARLNIEEEDMPRYSQQLSGIVDFIEQLGKVDTDQIEPMYHAFDMEQRLRPDEITEQNTREEFQKIAPQVEAGLYLVPKVIDEA
jgi:aspartyl-tRNA(Asn)/glutamyl-tRNA(Gln) amidotransferase subunit C